MPAYSLTVKLEFEVSIYDNNNTRIWNKIYFGEDTMYCGLYYNTYARREDERNTLIMEIFGAKIVDLKNDLEKAVLEINKALNKE
jgi:hypothetical protein